jgi:predicted nuclease of predicted toxin-antitoxin system
LRFLVDMGASLRFAGNLRAMGHDVVHLRDRGLQRLPDKEIFRLAAAERRIVLTFDLDFGEIAAHCGDTSTSVLLLRLANTRSDHVLERIRVAIEGAEAALDRGAVVVVEEGRCRIRPMPILPGTDAENS